MPEFQGKEVCKMFLRKLKTVLLLAAAISMTFSAPALAMHDVLDSDSYILEKKDGEWFCTDLEGEPLTGWVEDEDENIFYFEDGEMDRGWDKIKGEWYYFDPETGILATDTRVLNYDVDEDGRMVKIHEW